MAIGVAQRGWGSKLLIGMLLLGLFLSGPQSIFAACTGRQKCGVEDPYTGKCDGSSGAYTTEACQPDPDACYGGGCGGGNNCDLGDTCGGNTGGGSTPPPSGGGGGTPPGGCSSESAPAAPALTAPANGYSNPNTAVFLDWNAPASWGKNCPANANSFRLYVGTTNPPTTLVATLGAATTSYNYTGVNGNTYYWYVQARNGYANTNSAIRSFTITTDKITGTVYLDSANNCGGSGWSTGGVTVSLDGGAGVAVNGSGFYTHTVTDALPHTLAVSIPTGYICSTAAGCNTCNRSGIYSPSSNNNFYLAPQGSQEGWWQAQGGGVYAGSTLGGVTVRSQLPSASYRLILAGTGGTAAALLRGSGTSDLGAGQVSDDLWSTVAGYRGKRMDYNYFSAQLGVTRNQASDFGSDTLDLPSYDASKNFWYSAPGSGTATIATSWVIGVGEKYLVLVDGDLRIEDNITVPVGGYLAFIVSGNITIDPSVSSLQGVYIATQNFITESAYVAGAVDDVQLLISGNVIAWGDVELSRNLGAANSTTPGEKFVYRSDLLTNMTAKMKTFVLEWKEVVPGSFGD